MECSLFIIHKQKNDDYIAAAANIRCNYEKLLTVMLRQKRLNLSMYYEKEKKSEKRLNSPYNDTEIKKENIY